MSGHQLGSVVQLSAEPPASFWHLQILQPWDHDETGGPKTKLDFCATLQLRPRPDFPLLACLRITGDGPSRRVPGWFRECDAMHGQCVSVGCSSDGHF
ncbi:protein of unknown function [Paraburkholderia kururiensis]